MVVAIVAIAVLLVVIALCVLFADTLRGAIGGRQTLERARLLMVVSTDDQTERAARDWIERFTIDHPGSRCLPLRVDAGDDGEIYMAVQQKIAVSSPDALVWALPEGRKHSEEGPYAMAKRELSIPMDAIYVAGDSAAVDG